MPPKCSRLSRVGEAARASDSFICDEIRRRSEESCVSFYPAMFNELVERRVEQLRSFAYRIPRPL